MSAAPGQPALRQPQPSLQRHVWEGIMAMRGLVPKISTRSGERARPWPAALPSFVMPLANPTLLFDVSKHGVHNMSPEAFMGMHSWLVLFAPHLFWPGLVHPCCPLCSRRATPHGWSTSIRRVTGLFGVWYVNGTRYLCKDCPGGCPARGRGGFPSCGASPRAAAAAGGPPPRLKAHPHAPTRLPLSLSPRPFASPPLAGLAAGMTYNPEAIGEAVEGMQDLPEDLEDPEPGGGAAGSGPAGRNAARGSAAGSAAEGAGRAASGANGAAASAGGPPGAQGGRKLRQQQQQEKRQATLAKKQERQQKNLTFMAYDPGVVNAMPSFVKEQVPFIITARGGIDKQTMQLAKMSFASGVSIKGTADRLKEMQWRQHYEKMLIYYSFAAAVQAKKGAVREQQCAGAGPQGGAARGRSAGGAGRGGAGRGGAGRGRAGRGGAPAGGRPRAWRQPPRRNPTHHPPPPPSHTTPCRRRPWPDRPRKPRLWPRPGDGAVALRRQGRRRRVQRLGIVAGGRVPRRERARARVSAVGWGRMGAGSAGTRVAWRALWDLGLSSPLASFAGLSPLPARYMGLWLAALGAEVLKLDHSFKVVRRCRGSAGDRQFAAVLTVMNEFCQVRGHGQQGGRAGRRARRRGGGADGRLAGGAGRQAGRRAPARPLSSRPPQLPRFHHRRALTPLHCRCSPPSPRRPSPSQR
jgi:hypothetical protein